MKINKMMLMVLGIILASALVSAGCCYDTENGYCSFSSDQTGCTNLGGEYHDEECNSVSTCQKACCVLGEESIFTTPQNCKNYAETYGFSYPDNFQQIDEKGCYAGAGNEDVGACAYDDGTGTNACKFITREECNTDFYEGQLCSAPELETSCTQLPEKMCYNKNVHYVDSCGNPDALVASCDYSSGSICEEIGKDAKCKSLNCEVEITRGALSKFLWKPVSESNGKLVILVTGGLGASIYGPNGKLIEKGSSGGPSNGYADTIRFSKPGAQYPSGSVVHSGGSACLISNPAGRVESCVITGTISSQTSTRKNGERWCVAPEGFSLGNGGYGSSMESVEGEATQTIFSQESFGSVGSRYFTQYCLNGEVYDEPCGDFRMEYCGEVKAVDGELLMPDTNGKCEINPWQECLAVNGDLGDKEKGEFDLGQLRKDCVDSCYVFRPLDCVTFADPATGGETENICGENRQNWRSYAPANGYDPSTVKEVASELLKDLELEMCLPKIPGGIDFWPSEKSGSFVNEQESACSYGDYTTDIMFEKISGVWYFKLDEGKSNYFHNAALITSTKHNFEDYDDTDKELLIVGPVYLDGEKVGIDRQMIQDVWAGGINTLPLNPTILTLLNGRCQAIGDCEGKVNWIGKSGSKERKFEETEVKCEKAPSSGGNAMVKCSFKFSCEPFKPPYGSEDCGECGADGLPCSEYRCKSLGKACDYFEPSGADQGFCVSSEDNSPPGISYTIDPKGLIPAYSSVKINIQTDEVAECKFDIGTGANNYEGMQYSAGTGYGLNHEVVLFVPGQKIGAKVETQVDEEGNEIEPTESLYGLLTDEGKYELYVRCQDGAGNWNVAPELIKFEVDKKPDFMPPQIFGFSPENNGPVQYNLTETEISFKITEPAECKWDFEDKEYDLMNKEFNCDEDESLQGIFNAYSCSGIIEDLPEIPGNYTSYYIKCKDQPWLEGQETDLYKRNTMVKSVEYKLTASEFFEITSLTPAGNLKKSISDSSVDIKAVTEGGGYNGDSNCKYQLGNDTSFTEFFETGTSTSTQQTSQLEAGEYELSVKCLDAAGNFDEKTTTFELQIDEKGPLIVRAYNQEGALKVITHEEAICKYHDSLEVGCYFDFDSENATRMEGLSKEHTISWEDGKTYYIKCKDYYDNTNLGCAMIARTGLI